MTYAGKCFKEKIATKKISKCNNNIKAKGEQKERKKRKIFAKIIDRLLNRLVDDDDGGNNNKRDGRIDKR